MTGKNNYMMDLTVKALTLSQRSGMGARSLNHLIDTLHGNMEQMTGQKIDKGCIPVADAIRKMNGSSIYHHLLPDSEINREDYSGQ